MCFFFCFIYTYCPVVDIAITGKCTDSKPGPWWVCDYVCVCVCRHACVMFNQVRVCVQIDMRRYRRFLCSSEKITLRLLPTSCQGQDPLTALHCYFFMFVKCGVSMHMQARTRTHRHAHTQMLSAIPIFSDTSLSSETEFVNLVQTTPLESTHSVSRSHLKTDF